ncbi:MAG: glycerol acyltransferase [Ardenticatenia bacterium]|nr:MAG: glycerol acyltransferase [Ardenticatenia bacterium]
MTKQQTTFPPLPPALEAVHIGRGWQKMAQRIFQALGWRVEGTLPNEPKFVIAAAPHTSNWDGVLLLLAATSLGVRLNWIGKHTLFRPPIGWFMRRLGGIPVDRRKRQNLVDQVAAAFAKRTHMILVIATEATRKEVPYWRSGFYYIALKAGVPILLAGPDYPTKRIVLGPLIWPSGDIDADMEKIAAWFNAQGLRGVKGKPMSPVRLRPRDDA